MPALARFDTNTATNKLLTEQQPQKRTSETTDISVTARIEYIFSYSKQAVLVVADKTEQYSTVARQLLVNLSGESVNETSTPNNANNNQSNVAFVSASLKLNDIQIRCRLIEQLFSNSLFDPEQSLVVSVLRLAKQQGEAITIVVEHAHGLSLQIKYELCQLVAMAKQNQQVVNVVMFSQPDAADEVYQNRNIFKNKLAIVDAKTGQLYDDKSRKTSEGSETKWLSFWQKIVLNVSIVLMIVITVSLYTYLQTEQGSQYLQQPIANNESSTFAKQFSVTDEKLEVEQKIENEQQEHLLTDIDKQASQAASVKDINHALISTSSILNKMTENSPAKTKDVLGALLTKEVENSVAIKVENKDASNLPDTNILNANKPHLIGTLDTDYYMAMSEGKGGVVIQVAGFSNSWLWQKFLALYPQQVFFSYQKNLANNVFTVVTSKVYPNRLAAKEAMQALPEAITQQQLWLKPISTVIAEINTLKE